MASFFTDAVYSDEKSELGMEELTAEADTLQAIHDKVCK